MESMQDSLIILLARLGRYYVVCKPRLGQVTNLVHPKRHEAGLSKSQNVSTAVLEGDQIGNEGFTVQKV